jgi:hypothetical protein
MLMDTKQGRKQVTILALPQEFWIFHSFSHRALSASHGHVHGSEKHGFMECTEQAKKE